MDIQVHSMDIQVKHNDQLATTLKAYHDAGQETKKRLRALDYEQTRFAHEILSCLEKLSMTQKDCFEELKRELQFRPDELQNTVNRAIANTTEESTSATEIGSSVNRLIPSVETLMLPNFLVGISEPLQKLKEQLVSEKENVMVVGIKGMGGIGKTTLASALFSDQEVRDFFKGGIHFVTVSQSPNLLEILKSVWKKLIGGMVPCFQNKEDARRQLQGAISSLKSPMLMVLDDVWSRAHLEDLIFQGEQCKIVFTTRQVCTVSVKDAFLYEVNLLSEDDALRLFCFYAFKQESIPERYNTSVVKEVQDKCKRLPLALKVVGECLVGKLDIFWRSAKKKLRQAQAIDTYHKEALLEHLQTSFDAIEDVKLQQCFIDFGSFPEDREISVQLLFDMWIYVRGMDGMTQ